MSNGHRVGPSRPHETKLGDALAQLVYKQRLTKMTSELLVAPKVPVVLARLAKLLSADGGSNARLMRPPQEDVDNLIEDVYGSILATSPDGTVTFAGSIAGYPASPPILSSEDQEILSGTTDRKAAHKFIALHCIWRFWRAFYSFDNGEVQPVPRNDPGLIYAAQNWIEHVSASEMKTEDLVDYAETFLMSERATKWLRWCLQVPAWNLTPTVDRLLMLGRKLELWAALPWDFDVRRARVYGWTTKIRSAPFPPEAATNCILSIYERYYIELKSRLAPTDPELLSATNVLGEIYACKGDYVQAYELQEKNLTLRSEVHGLESPQAVESLVRLARIQRRQGKWQESITSNRIACQYQAKTLGPRHPDTLSSHLWLAENLISNRDGMIDKNAMQVLLEAEHVLYVTLEACIKYLGLKHALSTLGCFIMAKLLAAKKEYGWAIIYYLKGQKDIEQVYGTDHNVVLSSLNELGTVFQAMGRPAQCQAIFDYVLKKQKRILGEHHPDVMHTLWNLGLLQQEQGRYDEAIATYNSVIPFNERIYGDNHRYVLKPLYHIAEIHLARKEDSEALPLLERVVANPDSGSRKTMQLVSTAATELVKLYERNGKTKEAEVLREKIPIPQGVPNVSFVQRLQLHLAGYITLALVPLVGLIYGWWVAISTKYSAYKQWAKAGA